MATRTYSGNAGLLPQITTIAVTGTWATNDTATLTINGKSVTFTVGSTQTADAVVVGLVSAWNASDFPEMKEVTASGSTSPITLTGDTDGEDFTVSVAETTAGSGALGSPSESQAASGPGHWDNADNWAEGSVPVNSDDVIIPAGSPAITSGLDQSAVTVASLKIYSDRIGRPTNNANGYVEYRDTYLAIGATSCIVGDGASRETVRIKLDFGSVQTALEINKPGTPADSPVPAILIQGSHASNTGTASQGRIGIAYEAGQSGVFTTWDQSYQTQPNGDTYVECGTDAAVTTATVYGGQLTLRSGTTLVTQYDGTVTLSDGAHTEVDQVSGICYHDTGGTITTVDAAGQWLAYRTPKSKTTTNFTLRDGASFDDRFGTMTATNGIDLANCGIDDLSLFRWGKNHTLTKSAI